MAWRRPLHAREDLLRTARRLLAQGSTRVLTLTGLPGVGTTSMARALVAGAPQQQEVPFVDGRRATEPGALSRMALEAAVASDLVVVDDADRSPDAANELASVLEANPQLRLLVTSGSPLHLSGETVVRVPPLPEPDLTADPEAYAGQPAVRVFRDAAERSGAILPGDHDTMRDVAHICAALGGNPGAIVMAAARTPTLPPAQLRELLTTSSPSTVIASPSDADRDIFTAIAWSASLLSEDSRAVLRDLAVFTSLVPLEAIEAVTGRHHLVDPLSTLVDAHLVEPVHAVTESHYRLHPLVRERATALLSRNPDHLAELEHRHTEWAAGVASEALRLARSGQPTASLALVGAVEPEILVALQRTTQAGDAVLAAQLLLGIAQCWFNRGPTATEQQWIERVTALAENHPVGSGVMAMLLAWRGAVGVDLARDAEGVAAALPDLHSALARAEPGWVRTRILILAVQAARAMDDRSAIEPLCREGIAEAQELDDQASLATFESFAAMLAHQRDAIPEAVHWGRQAFERALRVDDPQVVLTAAGLLRTLPPGTPLHDGSDEDVTAGVPSFEQLLDIARRTGDLRAVAWLLPAAAVVALHRGNIERSLGFSREALRRARVSGSPLRSLTPLLGVIVTAQQRGDHGVAAQLQEAVRPFRDVLKPSLPPWVAREYGDQLFDGSPVSSDAHALDGIAVNSRLAAVQLAAEVAYDYVRATSDAPVIRLAESLVDAGHLATNPQELTDREHEVLRALASGASNKEVAVVLGIRPKTVMHHTSSIYRKLGVRGRSEAVAWTLRGGWAEGPQGELFG